MTNSDCSPADEVAKVAEASAEVAEVAEAPAAAEPANAEAEPANAEAEHHPNIRYDRRGLGSYKVSCPHVPGICRKFPCKLYGKVGALKNAQVWLAYMEKESIRLQCRTSAELAPLAGSSFAGLGVPGEEVTPNAAAAHQVIEDFRPPRLDIALGWAA